MKIKEIPENERPRELLRKRGVESLNTEDLIAIIVCSGTKGMSSKDIALKIMKLETITLETLMSIKGVGYAKASKVVASIEFSKRLENKGEIFKKKINNSEAIYNHFKSRLSSSNQEHFYCVFLDSSKKIIKEKLIFVGTLNYSVVHPREIFKEAYLSSAAAIICVHNHPSKNMHPSVEDKEVTNKLKEISKLHGISFLDHIIIAGDEYFSFHENGYI